MENVVLASNNAYKGNAYNLYKQMTSEGIDPTSADEIRTIVEAARNGESYDTLMKIWDTRWEKSRPSTMTVKERSDFAAKAEQSGQSTDGKNLESIYVQDYEVEFSDTEKEYIDTKKKLKVGYIKDKAPFQYQSAVSSEGLNEQNFAGLSAYLCNTIEESSGIEIEYVAYKNESEVISALRSGKIDMAAGIKTTDLDGIKYSKDYIELTNVIIKNENVDTNNLEGSRQVFVEGEFYDVNVVNNYVSVDASSLSNAIKEVNNHNADFTIADYYSAEYYINESEYTHVSVIPLTSKTKLAFAYANDVDTRLISITNKCIYSLSDEEMQLLLMQNMDTGSEPVTFRRFIETNPILALVLGMSIVAVIAIAIFIVGHEKRKSERKREIDNKRYKILSQLTDEYVFEYDLKSGVVHFENKFVDKFNFSQNVDVLDYDESNEALKVMIDNCNLAKEKDSTTIDGFEITDVKGSTQWYRMIAYRILDSNGRPRHIIGKIMNIQKTMEETRRIQDEADRDPLTGIYNRNGFDKSFTSLTYKYGSDTNCVFVMVDFDSFKAVNDSLGHEGGDIALKLLGDNLAEIERDNIICARYGGDEFMICMFDTTHDKAGGVLKDLIRKMNTDLVFHGVTHHISISIGAVYSETILPFHKLFGEADAVLYDVKANGKNGYKFINI
jgi:diguanylate cyclase (GGDEF)-like protein